MKDPEYVAKLEKAVKEKYGDSAVENPRSYLDEESIEEYKRQLKEAAKKRKYRKVETIEQNGFTIEKKLVNNEQKRVCPVCSEFSFDLKDDLYMNRFDCCFKCYVQWVEDREERWKDGWRPNDQTKSTRSN